MRFAANLTLLFTELPFLERFAAARQAGFAGVECLFPYEFPPEDVRHALQDCGLPLVLFNFPPGNWQAGERGHAACPDSTVRFRDDTALALDYAEILKPRHLHVMAGIAAGNDAFCTFVQNLRLIAGKAPRQSFLIEPINPFDMPGYYLKDFDTAQTVLKTVAANNVALQFDAYHAHRITQDVAATWKRFGQSARHIQIAGCPGRHEPAPSDIDYRSFLDLLKMDGYREMISGEYTPRTETVTGLGWLETLA